MHHLCVCVCCEHLVTQTLPSSSSEPPANTPSYNRTWPLTTTSQSTSSPSSWEYRERYTNTTPGQQSRLSGWRKDSSSGPSAGSTSMPSTAYEALSAPGDTWTASRHTQEHPHTPAPPGGDMVALGHLAADSPPTITTMDRTGLPRGSSGTMVTYWMGLSEPEVDLNITGALPLV